MRISDDDFPCKKAELHLICSNAIHFQRSELEKHKKASKYDVSQKNILLK